MASRFQKILANPQDLGYALQKGLMPFIRGLFWQALRLRKPRILFLGNNIRFVSAGNVHFGNGVSIGANSYIETCSQQPCVFADGVTLRENAWIQCRSGFNERGMNLIVESGAYIGPNAVIGVGGPIYIGAGCQIGARLSLSAEEHDGTDGSYTSGRVQRIGIRVGARSWLGNNVTVLDGVEIGEECVIGAGAVVTKSMPSGSMAVGVPARIVRNTSINLHQVGNSLQRNNGNE